MSRDLTSGHYKIISLTEGNRAVGTDPILPAYQPVRIGGLNTQCTLVKEGDSTIILGVGGYPYTVVNDDKVIASIHPEEEQKWRATYRKSQDAFTIALDKDPGRGWTVPADDKDTEILIKPIKEAQSLPPQYARNQLYRFERLTE